MSYAAVCLVVLLSAMVAAGASWLVDRYCALDSRQRHHAVGSTVFSGVGVMFSVLLAFVFSEVWGEYNVAAMAINGECGALHGAAMLASALPDHEGRPLDRSIAVYAGTVVTVEWPTMAARRRGTQAATDAFNAMLIEAVRLSVTRPAEAAIHGQIVSLLSQAHANRETRIFQLTQGLPLLMWVMLIAISTMLVGFVVFAGIESARHLLFSAAFTGCVVLVLALVRMLDYPFEGALALPATDFVRTLGEVSWLARTG